MLKKGEEASWLKTFRDQIPGIRESGMKHQHSLSDNQISCNTLSTRPIDKCHNAHRDTKGGADFLCSLCHLNLACIHI